ncbi:MAG: glycosyltransferase family 4 protein [Deltaproteobacteria bacterium]|nr:glycosyltransferase family 4 protein [Deltaproteobacteria bacterium]
MKKILALVPFPPPFSGQEIASKALFENLNLGQKGGVRILPSNIRSRNEERGRLDLKGVVSAVMFLGRLSYASFFFRPHGVYFLLSQSRMGFLRDFFVILIARMVRASVFAHYHGSNFGSFYDQQSAAYRWLIRFGLNRVACLIIQVRHLEKVFYAMAPRTPVRILYNALPLDILERPPKEKKNGAEKGISFLFINHICFTKGFYDLILAFEDLCQESRDVSLLVAGDFILNAATQSEFLSGEAKKFYRDHHIAIHSKIINFLKDDHPNVKFFGFVNDAEKKSLYETADIFVLPSYTEGLPCAVLEAMSFGLPLVTSPVGALPEILREGENVLFAKAGDRKSLVGQLKRLAENPSLRKSMGETNYRLTRCCFRPEIIQKEFSDILFRFLEKEIP